MNNSFEENIFPNSNFPNSNLPNNNPTIHLPKPQDNLPKNTLRDNLKQFLNTKNQTIITAAIALGTGFAFKDLIQSIVDNLIDPLIILIINLLQIQAFYDFSSLISPDKKVLNIKILFSSTLTFILLITIFYFIYMILGIK